MVLLCVVLRAKRDHLAVVEKCLTVAYQRCVDFLPNEVVSQVQIRSRLEIREDVQVVFTVGSDDRALVQ